MSSGRTTISSWSRKSSSSLAVSSSTSTGRFCRAAAARSRSFSRPWLRVTSVFKASMAFCPLGAEELAEDIRAVSRGGVEQGRELALGEERGLFELLGVEGPKL